MKTKSVNEAEVKRRWWVVDLNQQVVGRAASEIAKILRGKHTPQYTPHADTGDFVVVLNAGTARFTGLKESDKMYHHHTGWVGGLVSKTAAEVRAHKPTQIVEDAVWGMMPRGPLGRKMFKKLKVYAGAEHPHEAQNPQVLKLSA
ncbi:MAG: 50S ribosomal protein L13 [Myxococcota bacterium]